MPLARSWMLWSEVHLKTKPRQQQLITASEIGRHLFCARALYYDRLYPAERDQSLWAQVRRVVVSPVRAGSLLIGFIVLSFAGGLRLSLLALAFALLFLLALALWKRLRQTNSIIIYHGTRAIRNHKMLVASEFGLAGKPDYLLAIDTTYIPVITKKNPAPEEGLHDAYIMQLVAYCLLVAEEKDCHPPYGVLRYGDGRTFEVDFDEDAVEVLSHVMDEIEANRRQQDVPPNHHDRRRCYACSQRRRCDQSLF